MGTDSAVHAAVRVAVANRPAKVPRMPDSAGQAKNWSRRWCSSTVRPRSSRADAGSVSARSSWSATKRAALDLGLGKAAEVADAIRRGGELARTQMVTVALKDTTIPHEAFCAYGGAKILLRPASPGTGIIAGKKVRAVLESAGVKDVLTKSLGSKNAANVVKATLKGLLSMRLRETIYKSRGLEIKKVEAPKAPEAIPATA